MNFGKAWNEIGGKEAPLGDLPASRWKHPWSTHPLSARRLYNTVLWRKPATIVETGTFEGLGTYALAKAAQQNGGARIFTIDYDGDPDASIPIEDWQELRGFREENLDAARRAFPDVEIHFVEGDSRSVLPGIFPSKARTWDLFFQDSMHYESGIRAEWEIMKAFAAPEAVVIFDDVCLDWEKLPAHIAGKRDFCIGFALKEGFGGGWNYRSTAEGRAQFFACKSGRD